MAECIVAAALRVRFSFDDSAYEPHHHRPSELVLSVPRPGRHGDVFLGARFGLAADAAAAEQGFITNTGRFVDRKEGYPLAQSAGQIITHGSSCPGTLYSEDLW